MTPAFAPFLAWRYLLTRRINILGVCGVAFAVWAMLVVDGVFSGFVTDIHEDVRRSSPPLLLTDLPHDTDYEPLRKVLEADRDVIATAPRLRQHGMVMPFSPRDRGRRPAGSEQLEFDHTRNGFALLLGIDPDRERRIVDFGAWLDGGPAAIARYGGIRPRATAPVQDDPERRRRLQVDDEQEWRARRRAGLPAEDDPADHRSIWPGMLLGWPRVFRLDWVQKGDPFEVLVAAFPRHHAGGPLLRPCSERFAFAGWFGTGHRMFDELTALVPIDTLRQMLGESEFDEDYVELVTDVAIRPRDGLSPADLRALQRRLRAAAQAVLSPDCAPCSVLDWRQQNTTLLAAVDQEHSLMQIVLFVVMLVSAFVIYATLHMMVVQKIKDIGIVAAVGGSPRGIGTVFLLTGTIIAVLGTGLGVLAGVLSAMWLNPINEWIYRISGGRLELFPRALFDLQGIPCHLEPSWIVTVSAFAILLAVTVAFVPARRAARMHPVTALSFE
ncbi:MAG TPA: ABC transporter permease [bacterium]|nr:ABC transporter permease [bacterium]